MDLDAGGESLRIPLRKELPPIAKCSWTNGGARNMYDESSTMNCSVGFGSCQARSGDVIVPGHKPSAQLTASKTKTTASVARRSAKNRTCEWILGK